MSLLQGLNKRVYQHPPEPTKRALLHYRKTRGDYFGRPPTAHQVNPRADAHLLARLHHLQGLVEQYFAGESVVDDFDDAVGERETPPGGVFLHADAATEGKLEYDAPAKGVGDVVVPKGEVALCAWGLSR